ncbi:MAG TPA: hypothetical protein VFN56_01700 [Candidatus Saccharimonadales bacterium]|nr:hypothetical protein [Candidatus Saccharimonadales bacterium]
MTLRYQTGVAALIQFIAMTVLNFINGIVSSVQGCTNGDGCLGSVTINLMFFILITFWFAILAVLGYAAQDRRSKGITQLLLAAEILVVLIALFDTRHWPNIFGLISSLIDAGLALWVAILAFRLLRAKGSRITTTKHKHNPAT